MIKTIIAGTIIIALIGGLLAPDIVAIILRVKGSFLIQLSSFFSREAITIIFFELCFSVVYGLIKKL